ncbi:MAG: L,D-transpeptidase family protein [Desulfobacter sp.]|uniref:L,D-transpeptidase family protein n=1 Tax=Desulfobacter sp. TaxID=2294 RepID=UPI001B542EC8|nr:L,D-transpeptidase family protein [Desulfobacter sp.]MBP8830614.1 L,D-transpeptidase family protein [Desulfobacter sp.]
MQANIRSTTAAVMIWTVLLAVPEFAQSGSAFQYWDGKQGGTAGSQEITVIGSLQNHQVAKGETLLDIARFYDLGFNEMADLYPEMDPWFLKPGSILVIPSLWILPEIRKPGIVINVAEMRLYHFLDHSREVRTFPVAVGQCLWPTPSGNFCVIEKRKYPFWYIPMSLQKKYGTGVIPPGSNNPLGEYFIGIGNAIGIHGTNFAWTVGRLVTHGCIRLYPEDIRELYSAVSLGTQVRIIYEPIKIGYIGKKIFLEAHRDIYAKINNYQKYALDRIATYGSTCRFDAATVEQTIRIRSGIPVEVGCCD